MRAWVMVVLLVGCGDSNNGGGADMASGLTDVERCQMGCAKMIACGVDYDSAACNSGCLQSTTFLGCLRVSALDDCNALAMCAFKQYGHDFCNGTSGVPAGAATCNTTADCEGGCNISGPQPACSCNCVAQLSPAKANALLINNQCAIAKCTAECSPASSGTACNTCASQMCGTEHGQCATQ